ncbi:Gfo/Idh/MocA family protein [Zavarzinella formosa]|uniref:Gfo/Idh/MocA family protein n=1 Tax=Zavarzinella formosa TaxID=360055 RepID=UPI00031CBE55|nr:Gfo/Idh/MocA family oxidoreductase [Zavarzinella formosa]
MRSSLSRRQFLATGASAAVAFPLLGEEPKKVSPNEKLNLGFIGVGTMGRGHLGGFLGMKDVQVVAVCDVVAERREDAQKRVDNHFSKNKKGQTTACATYADFRDLLAHKDLDAVVIATPDHWHTITSILAARGKKDIYCEKPLTHDIAEGRRLVGEVAKSGIIFQTGSQQRSEFNNYFRTAVELVRNGRIGKVKTIKIGVGNPSKPCDLPTQDVPKGTDWDVWLGPAPERGYNEILCPKGVHGHFPAWREYREYAGGGVADMGAHHFDIAQWALDMDNSGPVEIIPPEKDLRGLKLIYANGTEMIHGGSVDCEFIGEKGTIRVWRNKLESDPMEIVKTPIGESEWHTYPSHDHKRNWVECVRSRKQPICVAETGHRSATVCHLTNIGYQLRKKLRWDPVKEQFDDAEANKLVSREPREKWKI